MNEGLIRLWQAAFGAIVFTFGAVVGSFLNVCIYRIPRNLSVVRPRSFCPGCGKPIPWFRNLPILSWLLQRGRCAECGRRIRPRYVIVEALTATLFLLIWLRWPLLPGTPPPLGLTPLPELGVVLAYWLATGGLILGTFVDFELLIIPDRVTLGGILAGLICGAAVPALHGVTGPCLWTAFGYGLVLPAWASSLILSALGAGLGWTILWGIGVLGRWAFKREAMGFGDVKLIGAIGAFLGWRAVLFVLMVSSALGAVAGLTFVAVGCKGLKSRIPFGPYLALAAVIWMLWGPALWSLYLNLLAPAPY